MKTINVTIEGTTPLLCNRFADAAQMAAANGNRMSVVGGKGTPREQAEARLYLGQDGKPMIPQPNLFRCLIDAGKFFKHGKSKVTTQKTSLIPACVEVDGLELPIVHKNRGQWTRERSVSPAPAGGSFAIGRVSRIGSCRFHSTSIPTCCRQNSCGRSLKRPASASDWATSVPTVKGRSGSSW